MGKLLEVYEQKSKEPDEGNKDRKEIEIEKKNTYVKAKKPGLEWPR
jgi:hypothetical protein